MTDRLNQKQVLQFLSAVGDANRLQILFVIQDKQMSVTDIASHFKISRPAISHHLKILRDADIVTADKQGQEVYYSINKSYIIGELQALIDHLEQNL